MAKTLSIKTGKGLEIGSEKEVKAKIGNGIDFGNDNEVVAKGNTQKAIQVSEDGIELKVDNTTAKINEDGELEVVATKPDISAGGGIKLETPTGETTTEISVKTDNTTTRINTNGEIEAIGTKPDIESGNGIELNTPVGSTTTTITAKGGHGIEVNTNGINAKASDGIQVDTNGISAKVDNTTTRINTNGEIEAIGTKPDIESGNGIELNTPVGSTTTTITAKGGNGIEVDTNGINAKASDGIQVDTNGISAKASSGIVVNTNGISANINTDTLEFDDNGKINVKEKAPDIESGNGIEIATSGNTKTISAKGGNGIGVGTSGISVNTGSGLHISSNKVSINANFTTKDTPLGTADSNIILHSDGKISVDKSQSGGILLLGSVETSLLRSKMNVEEEKNFSNFYYYATFSKRNNEITYTDYANREDYKYIYCVLELSGNSISGGNFAEQNKNNIYLNTFMEFGEYVGSGTTVKTSIRTSNNYFSVNNYGNIELSDHIKSENMNKYIINKKFIEWDAFVSLILRLNKISNITTNEHTYSLKYLIGESARLRFYGLF